MIIELKNIKKTFHHNGTTIDVLKGIDLMISQGEGLAITGASGVGKSTLLNIMGTLETPSDGLIMFGNKDLKELEEKELCRLRNNEIGFVFQFHNLLPEFNALENTIIPLLIARTKKKEALMAAKDILIKVGLGNRLNHRVGELSGGEQQRVAIARSLIMDPKLLLADEPTGNLDRATGDHIIDLLLHLRDEIDLSMVIATHNLRVAERMPKQMELIDGRIK